MAHDVDEVDVRTTAAAVIIGIITKPPPIPHRLPNKPANVPIENVWNLSTNDDDVDDVSFSLFGVFVVNFLYLPNFQAR